MTCDMRGLLTMRTECKERKRSCKRLESAKVKGKERRATLFFGTTIPPAAPPSLPCVHGSYKNFVHSCISFLTETFSHGESGRFGIRCIASSSSQWVPIDSEIGQAVALVIAQGNCWPCPQLRELVITVLHESDCVTLLKSRSHFKLHRT